MATGDDLELGATNSADHETYLQATASFSAGIHVTNTGSGTASDPLTALKGAVKGDRSIGVHGHSSGSGVGVLGEGSSGIAVRGKATSGFGVSGEATSGIGVQGSSTGAKPGVRGFSPANVGVEGESTTGVGVNGITNRGTGVRGRSTRGTGVKGIGSWAVDAEGALMGVFSMASDPWGVGVLGIADGIGIWGASQSGWAGYFSGDVFVDGDFTKTGVGSCVAVPAPDGSLRRLYSIESPESWFEDFGEAKLVKGKAQVTIDPKFAALVRGNFHVFLTPYGDSNGLYVSRRTRKGFVVREQRRGSSSLAFSYRVVAKRKDVPGVRLEKVVRPAKPALEEVLADRSR